MGKTPGMTGLGRLVRAARHCARTGESATEALEQERPRDAGRRKLLASAVAGAVLAPMAGGIGQAWAGAAGGDVGIVGGGLAGLACADALAAKGIAAHVYEAASRVGGRCWSLRGFFPGQVAERGGEFIDTSHSAMRGYARAFGLQLEDVSKGPGELFYNFDGRNVPEAQVVEEFRAFVDAIRPDMSKLGYPVADSFSEFDRSLDLMPLDQYLVSRGAGALLRQVIEVAYTIEYGLSASQLSAIAFLRFIHADKRSKFTPFGVFSDERFHVVEGNDRISSGIAARLPRQPQLATRLVAVAKRASGRIVLTFDTPAGTLQREHDAVVLTLPFPILREVDLHASLGLPAWKLRAINEAVQGDNSKLMVGFTEPYWYTRLTSNGGGYSDRAHLQSTWETNPLAADETRAVMTDYTGDALARSLDPRRPAAEAARFLDDLEHALPGANAYARRDARGQPVAFCENWTLNPLHRGAYSANKPGYFTTIADNEAKPVDTLFFAGEHTSSFYEWQGFMEGAVLSGQRAAVEVVRRLR